MKRHAAKAAGNGLTRRGMKHKKRTTTRSVRDSVVKARMAVSRRMLTVERGFRGAEEKAPYGVLWGKCNPPSRF